MIALDELSDQFWTWRTVNQPDSYDDVTRVARPAGWTSDWSRVAINERRDRLRGFADQFAGVYLAGQPVGVQVNGRLLQPPPFSQDICVSVMAHLRQVPRVLAQHETTSPPQRSSLSVPRSSLTAWTSGWRRR